MVLARWTDQKVEAIVGDILRAGVLLAAVVVFIGGVVFLAGHWASPPSYRVFHGEPAELRSPGAIVQYSLRGHGRGLIQLGLLLLIATPVIRVAFAVVAFLLERDRMYAVIASIVLLILLYSLLGYQHLPG